MAKKLDGEATLTPLVREVFGKQSASGGRSLSPADNDSDDDLEEEEEEGVSWLTAMLNKSRELLTVMKTVEILHFLFTIYLAYTYVMLCYVM